ncbi:hypothetical protein [Lysobacter sp. A3-1-A15]|uniref:hypothetical protein n=1 Tax=Novilysobacter viscosus TaxID=3098602 RepID=UPI0039839253
MPVLENIHEEYGRFEALSKSSHGPHLAEYTDALYANFCHSFKEADYKTSVIWVGRSYLAAKKILLAGICFTQAEKLYEMNFRNLTAYTLYYALFSALSANLLINPHTKLSLSRSISHSALPKQIRSLLVRNRIYEESTLDLLRDLRFARELHSYHLPLSASFTSDSSDGQHYLEAVREAMPRVLQLSSLTSHVAYRAWTRKVGEIDDQYDQHQLFVDEFFESIVGRDDASGRRMHYDSADYYLLGYLLTRVKQPLPLSWLIEQKMSEELEIYWQSQREDQPFEYDPAIASSYLSSAMPV